MWLDRVKRVYGDDLEITWKNFSLEQVNSKEGPEWKSWEQGDPTERRSLLSQMAAEAARRQGPELYEKFHLALLTARHGGDDRIALNEEEPLIELAKDVGLDVGRFREDLKDRELAEIIGRDHEEAAAEGIFGTPTFHFDNGTYAYIKTFIPPEEDSVGAFEHFTAMMGSRSYIGEIKRPQPPWPKGALRQTWRRMGRLDDAEQSLGLSFRRRELLELAFVHGSYLNENPDDFGESNERMEFLGDALIGLVIAHELYDRFPERQEGELTALRSALVRGDTLAQTAASLGLGQFIFMGGGEEASGGRERRSTLAAVFEALVGAVLLDQGYEAARSFTLRALGPELESVGQQQPPTNSKSLLQEMVQAGGNPAPSYRIVEAAGADHARVFTAEVIISGEVAGAGTGTRKSEAEQAAAKAALESLQTDMRR